MVTVLDPTSRTEGHPGRDQDETAVGPTTPWAAGQFATVETFDDSRPTDSWALAWSEAGDDDEDEPYAADPMPGKGLHVLLLGVAAVFAAVGVGGLALTVSDTDSPPATSTTRVIVPVESTQTVRSTVAHPPAPAPTKAPVALTTSRPVAVTPSAGPVPMENVPVPVVTTAVVTTTVTTAVSTAVSTPPEVIADPLPPAITPAASVDWLPDIPVIPFPEHPVIDPEPADPAPPIRIPDIAIPRDPVVIPVVPIVVGQPVSGMNRAGQEGWGG